MRLPSAGGRVRKCVSFPVWPPDGGDRSRNLNLTDERTRRRGVGQTLAKRKSGLSPSQRCLARHSLRQSSSPPDGCFTKRAHIKKPSKEVANPGSPQRRSRAKNPLAKAGAQLAERRTIGARGGSRSKRSGFAPEVEAVADEPARTARYLGSAMALKQPGVGRRARRRLSHLHGACGAAVRYLRRRSPI